MECAYDEYRCRTCHKLLFKGVVVEAEIEVFCRACKELTVIRKSTLNPLICMIEHCPNRVFCPAAKAPPTI